MLMLIYLVALGVVGFAAYWLYEPDLPLDSMLKQWAKTPSKFMEIAGQSVHYRDEGDKDRPVILLLHGTSSSLHTWEGWVEELQKEWRVISLDLPGFGLTGPWVGELEGQDYSRENYARFLIQFMDGLGVERFVVAGNSLGAEVAWALTASAPKRVFAQILVDAAGYKDAGGQFPFGWRLISWPITGWFSMFMLPRFTISQGLRVAVADPVLITPQKIEHYRGLALRRGNRKALQLRLRYLLKEGGVQHIPPLSSPTLIIWGAKDRMIPPSNAERLLNDIPNSKLMMFDELGHIPQEEDPKQSVATAIEFLKSHAQ